MTTLRDLHEHVSMLMTRHESEPAVLDAPFKNTLGDNLDLTIEVKRKSPQDKTPGLIGITTHVEPILHESD